MPEIFTFQPYEALPDSRPIGYISDIVMRKCMPPTDPLPMDPSWYAGYSLAADQVMHESYREDVERVKPLLMAQLSAANARLTGHNVACLLTTHNGTYDGHTDERCVGDVTTAVGMALHKLNQEETPGAELTGVYLMGKDVKKPKYLMPLPEDYDGLAEHFIDWGPTIITLSPDKEEYQSIWASVHGPAYSVKTPSDFRDFFVDDEDSSIFPTLIKNRTVLRYGDAEFVAHVMFAGRKYGVEIYLTGSASGRGEISNALKREYEDIDLLVVTGENDPVETEAKLKRIAEYHFGPLNQAPAEAFNYATGQAFSGSVWLEEDNTKKVHIYTGRSMEQINYRPGNLERNYYHRVA